MKSRFLLVLFLFLFGCSELPIQPMTPSETEQPQQDASQLSAVRDLIFEGIEFKRAGDYSSAQASFERALRIESNNASVWFELAQLGLEQKKEDEAKSFAQRALSFVGDNPGLSKKIHQFLDELNK